MCGRAGADAVEYVAGGESWDAGGRGGEAGGEQGEADVGELEGCFGKGKSMG